MNSTTGVQRTIITILAILLLTLLTYPMFFMLYRVMIFNTVPRDDYAPYLLWLAHAPGGALPCSPYIYRIFSIALAWPLYHVMPVLSFTNLPSGLLPTYLRATASIALLSDICTISASVLCFNFAKRLGKSPLICLLSGLLVYAGCWFTSIVGIDTLTVCGVMVLTMMLPSRNRFWLVAIPLMFLNEKVGIILTLFLALRCATSSADRARFGAKLGWMLAAIGAYIAVLHIVHAPGNSYQTTPSLSIYTSTLIANLKANLSARGLMLSWGPATIMLLAALFGKHEDTCGLFSRRDALLVPCLICVGLVFTQDYQLGRLVMMAVPLFAIPAAIWGASLLEKTGNREAIGAQQR